MAFAFVEMSVRKRCENVIVHIILSRIVENKDIFILKFLPKIVKKITHIEYIFPICGRYTTDYNTSMGRVCIWYITDWAM